MMKKKLRKSSVKKVKNDLKIEEIDYIVISFVQQQIMKTLLY